MYLVDGNNVMGQRVGWHRDKPAAKLRLLEDLARFVRAKGVRLTVVFDGAPDAGFPEGTTYRGVKICYARRGSDADSRIVEMTEAERNKQGLIVVTSDGGLSARVRVCGVRVLRSGEFRRALEALPDGEPEAEPKVRKNELNEWLRYFGVDDD